MSKLGYLEILCEYNTNFIDNLPSDLYINRISTYRLGIVKEMMMRYILSIAILGVLAFAGIGRGATLAYTSPDPTPGNQNFGGNFGMDFTTNVPITVTQLALYDAGADGFAGSDVVTLFDSAGNVLAQLPFGGGSGDGTLIAGTDDRVKNLATPLSLPAGFSGTIAAVYGGGADPLANAGGGATPPLETGLPSISYVGSGRFEGSGNPNAYPTNIDGGPPNRYNGPSFGFTVPEPATLGLIGLGVVGLLARRRQG